MTKIQIQINLEKIPVCGNSGHSLLAKWIYSRDSLDLFDACIVSECYCGDYSALFAENTGKKW
jgi:hypothetical protein